MVIKPRDAAVAALLFLTPVAPAIAQEPDELGDLLNKEAARPPITEGRIDEVVDRIAPAYTRLRQGRGVATPELFASWVDVADYYDARRQPLDEQQRGEARSAYRRFQSRWHGFEKADEELVSPVREAVLADLAAHRAYWVMRLLGTNPRLGADQTYLNAVDRLAPDAERLNLLSNRDIAVTLDMISEAAEREQLAAGGDGDPNARSALSILRSGRYQLERAIDRFDEGKDFSGVNLVRLAMESFYGARSFGAYRGTIRDVLKGIDEVHDPDRTIIYDEKKYSLRGVMGLVLDEMIRAEERSWKSVEIPQPETKSEAPRTEGLVEEVEVTAVAGSLTQDLYVMQDLETILDEATGAMTPGRLEEHASFGTLLFHGLFREVVGERDYENLRGLYAQSGGEDFLSSGSKILMNPAIRQELVRSGDYADVRDKLAIIDSHEIWSDLGDLHVAAAREAHANAKEREGTAQMPYIIAARDHWAEARESYQEAVARPSATPLTAVQYNVAAAASTERNFRRALGEKSGELDAIIQGAYEAVIDAGPDGGLDDAPLAALDRSFRIYLTAAARMLGETGQDRYRRVIEKADPNSGEQFYFRGVLRQTLLDDPAGALEDYQGAYKLFRGVSIERAENAREKILSLGGDLPRVEQ